MMTLINLLIRLIMRSYRELIPIGIHRHCIVTESMGVRKTGRFRLSLSLAKLTSSTVSWTNSGAWPTDWLKTYQFREGWFDWPTWMCWSGERTWLKYVVSHRSSANKEGKREEQKGSKDICWVKWRCRTWEESRGVKGRKTNSSMVVLFIPIEWFHCAGFWDNTRSSIFQVVIISSMVVCKWREYRQNRRTELFAIRRNSTQFDHPIAVISSI